MKSKPTGDYWLDALGKRKKPKGGSAQRQQLPHSDDFNSHPYLMREYLRFLEVKNYSEQTVETRRKGLIRFWNWCEERDLVQAADVTRPQLENYQRWLSRLRKKNGKPLGFSTQCGYLIALRDYYRYLSKQHYILSNPSSELELPRKEHRLPPIPLTVSEMEIVLSQPDVTDVLGMRDRAILEALYSTGIRRSELCRLELTDLQHDQQTVMIRLGKGKKDRYLPIGERALKWIEKYLEYSRPQLARDINEKHLFITGYGEMFNGDSVSRMVTKYIKNADIGKTGSCHLIRHTMATLMLENGADIRFIQQMLGHASLETTQVYTNVSIRQLQQVHRNTHPGASEGLKKLEN